MDSLKIAVWGTCDCLRSRTSSRCERILSGYEEACGEWVECWRDPCSLLLKEKQTSDFLEVHLAHQIVLLFIKAAVLQPWLPWGFCSQQLVPIKSEPAFHHQQVFQEAAVTAELKRWLSSSWRRDGTVTGFPVDGLRACWSGQAEMDVLSYRFMWEKGGTGKMPGSWSWNTMCMQ